MQNIIKNLIKATFSALVVVAIVVPANVTLADDGTDYSYAPSDVYSGYDSYSYAPSDVYSGYDSYSYAPSDVYSGYDSYSYAPSDVYSGYGSTGYNYGTYSPSYSYLPYGGSSYYGGSSGAGLGLNLNYSPRSSNSTVKYNYSSSVDSHNVSNVTTNNTRVDTSNYCSNGTNCNTSGQVASATANLSVSCSANNNGNGNITWTANASGGNNSYSYVWSGAVSGTGQSVSQYYGNYSGTQTATVTVNSNGQTATASCTTYTNNNNYYNNNFSGSCYATPSNPGVGQQVTWYANASGGNGNYTYYWSGAVNGYGNYLTASYPYTGNQYATVRITDGSGNSITQNCQVNVGGGVVYYNGNGNGVNNGTLSSGVLLSSIPYTGIGENMKMAVFVIGMILWSAFVAWLLLRKKIKKGVSHKEMIEKFKAANLARKQARA